MICKFGEIEIYSIFELQMGCLISQVLEKSGIPDLKNISWLYPFFVSMDNNILACSQSFLIKSCSGNIIFDTCVGNCKNRPGFPLFHNLKTNFLSTLLHCGVSRYDIKYVICSHLHVDHIGWNTVLDKEEWLVTFPNAQYLIVDSEFNNWSPQRIDDEIAYEDSIYPLINNNVLKLVPSNYCVDPCVSFYPSPGHTHSHTSLKIESDGCIALISGDVMHHPYQIANPLLCSNSDYSREQAIHTRVDILESICDTDILFIGSHFSYPFSGYVKSTSEKYKFTFEPKFN